MRNSAWCKAKKLVLYVCDILGILYKFVQTAVIDVTLFLILLLDSYSARSPSDSIKISSHCENVSQYQCHSIGMPSIMTFVR